MVTTDEEDKCNQLAAIADVSIDVARRVLRKHKGNIEKAADALLSGDRATEAESWDLQRRNTPEPMYSDSLKPDTRPALPSSSVIDLTADDDDMTRAIQMSMESSQLIPQFGPTERAPHPEWQMVRSNDPVGTKLTNEDHKLNEAIEASLQDFKEDVDLSPLKETIREGGRPIALRLDTLSLIYAALVMQALYYIPQVRSAAANLRLPAIDGNAPLNDPSRAIWNLIELFTNMDLASLAALVDKDVIPSLEIPHLSGNSSLPEASSTVVQIIAHLIEEQQRAQAGDEELEEQLFSFQHGTVTLKNTQEPRYRTHPIYNVVVNVEYDVNNSPHNNLVSCLSDHLTKFNENGSTHDVIIKPSEVITFSLKRSAQPPSASKTSTDPFIYPKTIYLDQFLFANLALTNDKRKIEGKMLDEIRDLKAHRDTLMCLENGGNALDNLRSTIYYYEKVADPGDDVIRKRTLQQTAEHLKDILMMITAKVEDIDHKIEMLQAQVARVYECPELQNFQYDLRGVLFHTGLPGRKEIYSYVQDKEGRWWKTVDQEVTEVPEDTVLTDTAGFHLGAGPYMLFYSRHLSQELLEEALVWPTLFSEAVEENNKKFLALMHPELGIFSSTRSSPEPIAHTQPAVRELPTPGVRKNTGISREHSRTLPPSEDLSPLFDYKI